MAAPESRAQTILQLVSQPHGKNAPVDTIQSLFLQCYQKFNRLGEIAETRCSRVGRIGYTMTMYRLNIG